jgi:hypothetical protein
MKRFCLLILSAFFALIAFAQEGGGGGATDINVDINSGGDGGFWANPIVWVIGAAVFILLLVALLRGGRRD